jgi:hypothetical protein
MLETYPTPINNQTYLAPSFSRAFQQRASYRLVPIPDPLARLTNRGLKHRVAEERVALVVEFVVGILLAFLLR